MHTFRGFISLGIALAIAIVAAAVLGGAGWWAAEQSPPMVKVTIIAYPSGLPAANAPVTIQERVLCKPGAPCPQETLFSGMTDANGKILIPQDLIQKEPNILVENYGRNILRPCDSPDDSGCYPAGSAEWTVTMDKDK